ncbi:MAG: hypothetical protein Q9174_006215, partial [Haloplaca sp. 1 TL-2023]
MNYYQLPEEEDLEDSGADCQDTTTFNDLVQSQPTNRWENWEFRPELDYDWDQTFVQGWQSPILTTQLWMPNNAMGDASMASGSSVPSQSATVPVEPTPVSSDNSRLYLPAWMANAMGHTNMAPASSILSQPAPISSQPATLSSANARLQLPASCDPPGPHNPPEQCVWVIFGATGHIGRSVALAALAHNDPVTAVGRAHQETISQVQSRIPNQPPDRLLPTLCDVRVRSTVDAVIEESLNHWGRIDIIVNCTGYGVIGACEDQDEWDIRNQFEVGFWGTVNILHASLGYFRTRPPAPSPPASNSSDRESIMEEEEPRGGRYLIFSSTSGALGVPGLGPYSATKHAVEGLIESMLYETHAFNIKATLVEPGLLRHDTPDPQTSTSEEEIQKNTTPFSHFKTKQPPLNSAYTDPNAPAGHAKRMFEWLGNGDTQPTSTVRSAELVWQLGH